MCSRGVILGVVGVVLMLGGIPLILVPAFEGCCERYNPHSDGDCWNKHSCECRNDFNIYCKEEALYWGAGWSYGYDDYHYISDDYCTGGFNDGNCDAVMAMFITGIVLCICGSFSACAACCSGDQTQTICQGFILSLIFCCWDSFLCFCCNRRPLGVRQGKYIIDIKAVDPEAYTQPDAVTAEDATL